MEAFAIALLVGCGMFWAGWKWLPPGWLTNVWAYIGGSVMLLMPAFEIFAAFDWTKMIDEPYASALRLFWMALIGVARKRGDWKA